MTVKDKVNKCLRCGHKWPGRVSEPKQCPECNDRNWSRKRMRKPYNYKRVEV
jgi:rubrerythrin